MTPGERKTNPEEGTFYRENGHIIVNAFVSPTCKKWGQLTIYT